MPVMDGLQATRLIRSFEESGSWDAAAEAGIEQQLSHSDSSVHGEVFRPSPKRIPIIAVSLNFSYLSEFGLLLLQLP